MSRRKKAHKREFVQDPKYKSVLITQFINNLLRKGKKRQAESMVYDAIEMAGTRTSQDGLTIFKKAVDNVKPTVEVKSRRVGGANYQVPVEVPSDRRTSLAIRWLITYAKERTEKAWRTSLQMNSSVHPRTKAARCARRSTRTRWRKRTRHS